MRKRPIVVYLGGFARVGGIEMFARDFLLAIAETYPTRELVIWGKRDYSNLLLQDIADSGAKISSCPWRWGCLWNLPDFVLLPVGLNAVHRADAVIFKRPPPLSILRLLRRTCRQTGRKIPFILVTPYRPLEYWAGPPELSCLEKFDVITVQSDEGVQDLKKAGYRGRIENIPYFPPEYTEPVAYPASRCNGVFRLGFLGRMAAQKNLRYLLEIYQVLTQRLEQKGRYELHFFGDGNEREMLERTCADLSLTGVTFHGETPRAGVGEAIDSCDIFLNTSVVEGQCLVALEVLSRGRPLVATPVGALPEILCPRELGRLAPLGDPGAFASAIIEVSQDIQDGRTTPEAVVATFKARYDRADILRRYLNLLEEAQLTPQLDNIRNA